MLGFPVRFLSKAHDQLGRRRVMFLEPRPERCRRRKESRLHAAALFILRDRPRIALERAREDCEHLVPEGDEPDLRNRRVAFQVASNLFHGNFARSIRRVSVDAAADRGKRDRADGVRPGDLERRAIAGRQQIILARRAAPPYRPHCVNHVCRRKIEARGDARLSGRTTDAWPDLRHVAARPQQARSSRAVNGAIDTAASKHELVRRVDDRVDGQACNIGFRCLDSVHRFKVQGSGFRVQVLQRDPAHSSVLTIR